MNSQDPVSSTVQELARFAMANKKWWLLPLLVVSILAAVITAIGYTPLAPFIYTVF